MLPFRPDPTEESRRNQSALARYGGLGLQMAGIIGLGVWGGIWLDGRLGTAPWLTVGLLLLSVGLAFYQVVRSLREE